MQKVWTDASAKKKLVSRITMHVNTFLTLGTSPGRKSSLSSAMTSIWRGGGATDLASKDGRWLDQGRTAFRSLLHNMYYTA